MTFSTSFLGGRRGAAASSASGGRASLLPWALVAFAAAGARAEDGGPLGFDETTVIGRCVTRTVSRRGKKVTNYYVVTSTEVYLIRGTKGSHSTLKGYAGKRVAVTGRGVALPDGTWQIYVTRVEDITVEEDAPPWKGNVLVVVAGSRFSAAQYGAVGKGLKEGGYKAVVASSKETAVGMPEPRLKVDAVITDVRHLKPYRGIVFCGGPGIVEYEASRGDPASARKRAAGLMKAAGALVRKALKEGKVVGAVALAPAVVLAPTGALKGKSVTGSTDGGRFRAFKKARARYTGRKVERDGNLVTARFEGLREFARLLVAVLDENLKKEQEKSGGSP